MSNIVPSASIVVVVAFVTRAYLIAPKVYRHTIAVDTATDQCVPITMIPFFESFILSLCPHLWRDVTYIYNWPRCLSSSSRWAHGSQSIGDNSFVLGDRAGPDHVGMRILIRIKLNCEKLQARACGWNWDRVPGKGRPPFRHARDVCVWPRIGDLFQSNFGHRACVNVCPGAWCETCFIA